MARRRSTIGKRTGIPLPEAERLEKKIRQGVRYPALEGLTVMDPATMARTPADGETIGEVMFQGNIVMKGYLKNKQATEEAFAGGWFHSGDLGVMHADGYIQLKDRSKDIIISGGENISSIEVEDVLYKHPAVLGGRGGRQAGRQMGRDAVRFCRERQSDADVSEDDLIAWCRENLAHFKCPRKTCGVHRTAQDLDRQDPEIQAQGNGERSVREARVT